MSNKESNAQNNASKLNLLAFGYCVLGIVISFVPIFSIIGIHIPEFLGGEIDPTIFLAISLGIFFVALATFVGIIIEDREQRFQSTILIKDNLCKLEKKIHDSEILINRDYEGTIREIIRNTKDDIQGSKNRILDNEIFLVMRTGQILSDCMPDFEKAIIAGCNLKVIVLDKEYFYGHPSLLMNIIQEGEEFNIVESINILKGKFRIGNNAINHLKNISKASEARGSFEVRLSREYITSQLICLANIIDSTGYFFSVPLFRGINPRQSDKIFAEKKYKRDLFEDYKNEISDLWNYTDTSKYFDKYLPEERVLLYVEEICKKEGDNLVSSLCSNEIGNMYRIFRQYGFVIIRPKKIYPDDIDKEQNYIEELLSMKNFFGEEMYPRHERADISTGITEISYNPSWSNDYLGTNNKETGLHTDCTYADIPPKVVIHQCVKPSEQGGESWLVSCKNVYNKMIGKSPEAVATLTCPGDVFKIKRAKLEGKKKIFCECEDQRFQVFFRSEYALINYTSPECENAFFIFKDILDNERDNIFSFKLKSHDILVIDNTSILHGRNEFPGYSDRKLYRILLDGNIKDKELLHFGFHVKS